MRHCCRFKPAEIYYLADTYIYSSRKMSIGFCPICGKPVVELQEIRFDGEHAFTRAVGIEANSIMLEHKDEILFTMQSCNSWKFKSKPYGWKYGVNKLRKHKNKEEIEQYAYDFYGNKELIKKIK